MGDAPCNIPPRLPPQSCPRCPRSGAAYCTPTPCRQGTGYRVGEPLRTAGDRWAPRRRRFRIPLAVPHESAASGGITLSGERPAHRRLQPFCSPVELGGVEFLHIDDSDVEGNNLPLLSLVEIRQDVAVHYLAGCEEGSTIVG